VARHHLNEVENGTGKKQQPQDETVKDEFQVKVEDGQARKRENKPQNQSNQPGKDEGQEKPLRANRDSEDLQVNEQNQQGKQEVDEVAGDGSNGQNLATHREGFDERHVEQHHRTAIQQCVLDELPSEGAAKQVGGVVGDVVAEKLFNHDQPDESLSNGRNERPEETENCPLVADSQLAPDQNQNRLPKLGSPRNLHPCTSNASKFLTTHKKRISHIGKFAVAK